MKQILIGLLASLATCYGQISITGSGKTYTQGDGITINGVIITANTNFLSTIDYTTNAVVQATNAVSAWVDGKLLALGTGGVFGVSSAMPWSLMTTNDAVVSIGTNDITQLVPTNIVTSVGGLSISLTAANTWTLSGSVTNGANLTNISLAALQTLPLTNVVLIGGGTVAVTGAVAYVSGLGGGGGDVYESGTNDFTSPITFSNSILMKNGVPIATLSDIYEIAFGSLSNLRPTNTALPAITGDITNGASVTVSYGTFYSIRAADYQTNQCWVWVDDAYTNGTGYYLSIGTNTPVSLATVSTQSVLYVGAAMTNLFGMGSAISLGYTVTNAVVVVEHWRIKSFGSGPDVEVVSGGTTYTQDDVVTVVDGSETTATQVQVNVTDGIVTSLSALIEAGDYPSPLADGTYATSGGTGSGLTLHIGATPASESWEQFTP